MDDTPPEQAPGMRQLRFADGLEHMFRRYHADAFLARMRWSLLVAAAVFLLFALLDAISLPEPVRTQVLALRLGLAWQDSPPTCPGRALHIAPGTCHFCGATVLL